VRPLWSGTITFGLVSIPVELVTAVRPRQTAMKLVDKAGHALGREYHCSKEDKKLSQDELVRGYETDSGKMVVITDEEFESVAPEMSGDIELRNFVPLEQIPPIYFNRPYFLAPSGKSTKAYHLLTATMEKAGRVGIGSFVMRGHEYLVAIIADNGVLRADTLRYADEIRTPETIGLSKRGKATASKVTQFVKIIEDLATELAEDGNPWRLRMVGALDVLPAPTAEILKAAQEKTATRTEGVEVNLAVGYGGRREITDAVRSLLYEQSAAGRTLEELAEILDVEHIAEHLYTRGQPDPDLVIRTSGEQRLSGFLLWQSAHSEFYFHDANWPDFRRTDFLRALRSYAGRQRRYGA